MSHWLFKTAVASSLFYQNYQLSQIRGSTEEIERVLKGAANEHAHLAFLKEKIYTIRKGLEVALERIQANPHRALYFALAVQQFFKRSNITTASFPEINDKIYFDKTLEVARILENRSGLMLPDGEPKAVADFMIAQQCKELLGEYILSLREPEVTLNEDELTPYRDSFWNGRVWGLGCLAPIAGFVLIGLILSAFGVAHGDGMVCIGCVTVLGIFLAVAVTEDDRARKRRASEEEVLQKYAFFATKRKLLQEQLQGHGFDCNKPLSELRKGLTRMGELITHYSPIIPNPAL